MKTQDKYHGNNTEFGEKSFYMDKYNNFDVFNQNAQHDKLLSNYNRKEKRFHYDNSIISQSYGESNIEKCSFVISSILLYSIVLGYVYVDIFSNTKFYIFLFGVAVDFLISVYYLYLYFSLKNEQIFQKVTLNSYSSIDMFILVNYLNKIILIVLIFFDNSFYYLWCLTFFVLKIILDTYFIMISLKLFMLSPCMIKIQEFFQRLWNNIKYYILCCEEETDLPDYTKLEELESFY